MRFAPLLILDVTVEPSDVRIAVVGEVCIASVRPLELLLAGIGASLGSRRVVVDLADTHLLAVTGIAALEAAAADLERGGGRLVLTGAAGLVRRTLEVCGAGSLLGLASGS